MNRPLTILGTLAATTAAVVIGVYAFVNSGIYDVSATTPDSWLVYWATHQTMEHSIARRLKTNVVPVGLDAAQKIAEGGALYVENCAICHGAPGVEATAISLGLNPTPPDLFLATRKPNPAENFQFVKHGIKMTAMPAFSPTKTDDEIWAIIAFLNIAPGISPADFVAKTGTAASAGK